MNGHINTVVSPTYVIAWSLPSLLSVLLFACLFLISRASPIWPHTVIAEGSFYWFLTITPVTIIVAMVRVMRCSRRQQLQRTLKVVAWGMIVLSIMLNGIVVVELLAAFYY